MKSGWLHPDFCVKKRCIFACFSLGKNEEFSYPLNNFFNEKAVAPFHFCG